MAAREKLLREPPLEFLKLRDLFHQDYGLEVTRERGVEGYLADFIPPKDAAPIGVYIDALLARDDIDNGDLKGLLKRSWGAAFAGGENRRLLSELRAHIGK